MADNTAAIADLDDVIRAGAETVEVDGQKVAFNLDALKKERRDLIANDNDRKGDRPRVARIYLGGF